MRSYIERAKDFIKDIYPFIETKPFNIGMVEVAVFAYNKANHRNVLVKSGSVRIALITSDYVVKYDYSPCNAETYGGCEQELKMYNLAKEQGFDDLFAEITHFQYGELNFYIMPRITGIGKDRFSEADDFMTQEERDFCYDAGLCDLHYYNFGFRKGRICIVDYACFGY